MVIFADTVARRTFAGDVVFLGHAGLIHHAATPLGFRLRHGLIREREHSQDSTGSGRYPIPAEPPARKRTVPGHAVGGLG